MRTHHHHLIDVEVTALRPTQVTVGLAEVAAKRVEWQALGQKARERLLASHWFPAVLGPDAQYFIVDHHHLGRALLEESVANAAVMVLADLSWLDARRFWRVMEFHQWAHPYDESGNRCDFADIPQTVADLRDDPYRSLAGLTREHGGFAKDATPFAEFLWADHFRALLPARRVVHDLATPPAREALLHEAVRLARQPEARYLPGWSGYDDSRREPT